MNSRPKNPWPVVPMTCCHDESLNSSRISKDIPFILQQKESIFARMNYCTRRDQWLSETSLVI